MLDLDAPSDAGRRLPWLLIFRAAVAIALLALTLIADISDSSLRHISLLLYAVVIGTFLLVLALGLLLRTKTPPAVISAIYLAMALAVPVVVVQATGGVESLFSFLFFLAILDAAIIRGRQLAVAVASACSLIYGAQLVGQLHGFLPSPVEVVPLPSAFAVAAVVHIGGFYLVALLAGYLADLVQHAREDASVAQVDLERAEELHAGVLSSLPVGVITFTEDFRVVTVNPSAARIIGMVPTDLAGKRLPDGLLPFIEGGEQYVDREIEVGGRIRSLSLIQSAVQRGVRSKKTLRVLVLEDRTELRVLERDLHAKRRLAALGELAAAIAHEIRNPLAAISGAVELLTGESTGEATRDKLREIVLREIDRLNQLVGDFLVYARPASPRRVRTDLRALLEEVREVLLRDATWSEFSIKINAREGVEAWVDPRQFRQMVWNLLRNAREASAEQGVVEITLARDGKDLVTEIRDFGEGIPEDIRPFLFEPFRTTKSTGTGLGLAVVHRIVESHGGTIEIESEGDKGTTVRIVLPADATRELRSEYGEDSVISS